MSYSISSEKFTHPLLKPILLELTEYFKEAGISFFVIGATARDIIMELHNAQSGRLTYDLDIAITVNDWEQWLSVEQELVKLENFTKDKDQKQRFIYKGKFQLDIVPFGEIMKKEHELAEKRSDMPEDFRKEAVKFFEQFVVAQEKTIQNLKEKIK